MRFQPYFQIVGETRKPQFLLRDYLGREFGVVEHYDIDSKQAGAFAVFEFFSADPAFAQHPMVWMDLTSWSVLSGKGQNLPEPEFEAGFENYMLTLPESERNKRHERCKFARFSQAITMANQGYTLAYAEFFPDNIKSEDYPELTINGKGYWVDDQYDVQPGDFNLQVTLSLQSKQSNQSKTDSQNPNPEAALLFNWIFGQGYEIIHSQFNEAESHELILPLTGNPELEKIYRERFKQMRREGVLLGVKPKPYKPTSEKSMS